VTESPDLETQAPVGPTRVSSKVLDNAESAAPFGRCPAGDRIPVTLHVGCSPAVRALRVRRSPAVTATNYDRAGSHDTNATAGALNVAVGHIAWVICVTTRLTEGASPFELRDGPTRGIPGERPRA